MKKLISIISIIALLFLNINVISAGRFVSVEPTEGNKNGIVLELDNGDLLLGTLSPFEIFKSTDDGVNWTKKWNDADNNPSRQVILKFIDSNNNIYYGGKLSNDYGYIMRSSDSGENWTEVMVAESSSLWYMAETSNGDLFVGEYSCGNQDATEYYGYNLWKSTNDEVTWAKIFTHSLAPNTAPDYRDAIRHIHGVFADSNDNLFIGFGEYNYAGGGKTYRFSSDGTLGNLISEEGNGWTAFMETDDGDLLFGGDKTPAEIYKLTPDDLDNPIVLLNLNTEFGSLYDDAILGMVKGKDGVLYGIVLGAYDNKSIIIASADEGTTWVALKYHEDRVGGDLTLNVDSAGSRVYFSQSHDNNYYSIQDYTKAELKALYTSTTEVRGSITLTP